MITRLAKVLLITVIFLSLFITPAESNEMQFHIVGAGINLGWAATWVELQGITSGNQSWIEKYLNDAASHMETINSLLRAPFTNLDIPAVIREINRFWSYTASWSTSHRANYIKNIYSKLRQKLSNIYDSRTGMRYSPNCDSSFLDVGYHFGRAHMAAYRGNQTIRNGAHSSMTQAINEGLRLSGLLACGFGGSREWEALPLSTADTAQEYEPIYPRIQEIARNARGLSGSGGTSTPSGQTSGGSTGDIEGVWRLPDGEVIRISGSGNSFTGVIVTLTQSMREAGYYEGEVIFRFTGAGDNRFATEIKLTWVDNTGRRNVQWGKTTGVLRGNSITFVNEPDIFLTRIQ
jgi:hypothetical protein